jgi:hypothetical protein
LFADPIHPFFSSLRASKTVGEEKNVHIGGKAC